MDNAYDELRARYRAAAVFRRYGVQCIVGEGASFRKRHCNVVIEVVLPAGERDILIRKSRGWRRL